MAIPLGRRTHISQPDWVSNRAASVLASRPVSHKAWALARVAWPQRATSVVGVNQRKSQPVSPRIRSPRGDGFAVQRVNDYRHQRHTRRSETTNRSPRAPCVFMNSSLASRARTPFFTIADRTKSGRLPPERGRANRQTGAVGWEPCRVRRQPSPRLAPSARSAPPQRWAQDGGPMLPHRSIHFRRAAPGLSWIERYHNLLTWITHSPAPQRSSL